MTSPNYGQGRNPMGNAENGGDAAVVPDADRSAAILRAWFSQRPEARCLLAVDPSRRTLTDRPDAGVFFSEQTAVPVEIAHEAFPDEHRPYLIELDLSTPEGAKLLLESVRLAFEDRRPDFVARGQGQRIGGWLASTVPAAEVATYWSRQVVQVDESGRRCALRFYDSRALALIWSILTTSQKQVLLGPVIAWHALDACARACVYTAEVALQSSLVLAREQWQAIHRHGVVNKALGLHMHSTGRQPHRHEVETAVAGAARAEQYGLQDPDDKVAFVGHALAWHPRFDAHPRVREALLLLPGLLYSAAVSELSPSEIEEIRRGAWVDQKPTHRTV
jgi:hypothetical protein